VRGVISRVGARLDGVGGFERRVWAIASVVVVGAAISILATTTVNVALAPLARDLGASIQQIQWVVTGYLLALATVIPVTGWASERFGARTLWMTTVGAFVAASGLCAAAWSAESLIAFRVLQGLAGGMIMPIGMITLTLAVGPDRVGRAMSVIGVPMLLAPAFGPVIGGLLVEYASWRWIFLVNVPLGLAGLALAWLLLPDAKAEGHHRLDWRGLLLASPGVALLTLGLAEVPGHGGVGHPSVWGPGLAGLALIAAFVAYALRTTDPLIDVRLFAQRRLAAAATTTFLLGIALFGALVVLPLYFQILRGEDALTTGVLLIPQGAGAALGMAVGGRLTDRIGGGPVAATGMIILALGTLALTQAGTDTSYALLVAVLAVRGVGLGASMMPAMAAAFAALRPEAVPRATSGLNVIQRVGGSIGAALLATILESRLEALGRAATPDAVAGAFGHTFWWATALSLVAIPAALLLAREERAARRAARVAAPEAAQAEAAA
jgi:EmrB/QacA subfamily drug resistance transporter